jgi:GR25 family glycosyltransferase involved in LPS biosynthesis
MKTFVINLDKCKDRMANFNNDEIRWSATSYDEVSEYYSDKMISYYNISSKEHLCKTGCFLSHIMLWQYISDNKIDNVLILEDDAEKVNDISDLQLPQDGITYLGGWLHQLKMTDNTPVQHDSVNGINELDKTKMRMLCTLSYYIPKWQVAKQMLDYLNQLKRWRAIDVSIHNIPIENYYVYPAIYIEKDLQSNIRKIKKKHPNEYYEFK